MFIFAEQNMQYPDGQNNKELVPPEILLRGFAPPYKTPDGQIVAGDKLAANHLNYILNAMTAKIDELEQRIAVLEAAP
ncbi:phosphoglycolate phosphatase [Enterobacter asburiae]|nr:phosphoglycolate phosphatase [Enterobacter asburiae]